MDCCALSPMSALHSIFTCRTPTPQANHHCDSRRSQCAQATAHDHRSAGSGAPFVYCCLAFFLRKPFTFGRILWKISLWTLPTLVSPCAVHVASRGLLSSSPSSLRDQPAKRADSDPVSVILSHNRDNTFESVQTLQARTRNSLPCGELTVHRRPQRLPQRPQPLMQR